MYFFSPKYFFLAFIHGDFTFFSSIYLFMDFLHMYIFSAAYLFEGI